LDKWRAFKEVQIKKKEQEMMLKLANHHHHDDNESDLGDDAPNEEPVYGKAKRNE